MILSTLFFGAMNLCIKLVREVPFYEIVFFRSLVTLIISYFFIKKARLNPWGNNKKLLILRGLAGFVGLTLYFYTVQNMSLASAVTIQYLSPIFTTVFAIFILKQKIRPIQFLFFAVAFSGVFFIKGFDDTVTTPLLLIGIGSAIASGFAYNMIAKLRGQDNPMVIVFYFPLVTLPLITPVTAYNFYLPGWTELLLLILIGVFTQFAQILMTKAYQLENAANISIMTYLGLFYALLIGKFIFKEEYTEMTLLGMMLIVLGIFSNIFYSRRINKLAVTNSKQSSQNS